VVEKFLTSAGKSGAIMAADQAREGALPMDRQTFQAFEKFPFQQCFFWGVRQGSLS
jgi:hypothetical protein